MYKGTVFIDLNKLKSDSEGTDKQIETSVVTSFSDFFVQWVFSAEIFDCKKELQSDCKPICCSF